MKLAVILRRLVGLVKEEEKSDKSDEDRSVASEETRRRIEGFCERFEKEVLGLFDRWYRFVILSLAGSRLRAFVRFAIVESHSTHSLHLPTAWYPQKRRPQDDGSALSLPGTLTHP